MLFTGCEKDKKPDDCMGDDLRKLCIHGGFSSMLLITSSVSFSTELQSCAAQSHTAQVWRTRFARSLPPHRDYLD